MKAESKGLESIEAMLTKATRVVDDGLPASAVDAVIRAKGPRALLAQQDQGAAQRLDELVDGWRELAVAALGSTAKTFPAALAAHGLALDASSRDPRYTLRESFITVVFDKKKATAVVQTRGGKKQRVPADPSVVADRVAREHERCFGRSADLPALAQRLREAVDVCAGRRVERSAIPILDVLAELQGDGNEPRRDEFSVDLAKLITDSGDHIPGAAGLRLEHTKDDKAGLLLPGLESRGYFGYVRFTDNGRDQDSGE